MSWLLIQIYRTLIMLIALPFCLAVRKHPNFAGTLRARLGMRLPDIPHGKRIWLHASSLGEVKAAAGLIAEIKARRPDIIICLSAMTATGRQAAQSIPAVDVIMPMPFDLPWVMRRMLGYIKPQALIIIETEIWPNMLLAANALKVPVVFVNARMSAKAFSRYRLIRPVTARILAGAHILAMDSPDAQRFATLGAHGVEMLGNLKFDAMQAADPARAAALRQSLGLGDRPVFVAGSVREDEEAPVMEAIDIAMSEVPGLCAIVAPRHQDRIPLLCELSSRACLSWALRSAATGEEDVIIVDSVGELFTLYGLAQAAFVGGSLVDLGGQNILEPIAWGVPTIHGPSMDNFLWALGAVRGHTREVCNTRELSQTIADIMHNPEPAAVLAKQAKAALAARRGIVARYADRIVDLAGLK